MAKAKPCRVIAHGSRREINWGEFPSIAKAKESLRYWNRPYTIIPLEK